ncbi:hypothetical protein IEO21_06369 [Rhodonia placenta]|uniref:Enoyl reductase (ER) domain-containing protein n=1 Tax=Rhodonia placenta TaxID=104341 RepID=A0A8H7P040_9APHY|nr:hypothetical protein IEO21_06369 [Postia placenta]
MPTQKGLILPSKQGAFRVDTIPIPKPGSGEILIKVAATALNPVDWKIQAYGAIITHYPAILGGDIAGTVEALGPGVTGFTSGDRVITQGMLNVNEHASFQQYTLGYADVTAQIPDDVPFEEAATIPLALATAALGLFNKHAPEKSAGLVPPWTEDGRGLYEDEPLMVFGGSSSVGQYVIQLAVLAGFSPIIATASPQNADYLLELGATHVIDRNLSADETLEEVSAITTAPIETIYDAVAIPETQNLAYDLLAPGGCLVLVLGDAIDKRKKRSDKRVVQVGGNTNAPDANRRLGRSLYSELTVLLEDGDIQGNRVEILPDGLEGIIGGLARLRQGVSNVKLVAHPQETE